MAKQDAIIMIGGGWLQLQAIREIYDHGYVPIVTDQNSHCPAVEQETYIEFFQQDTYDIKGHFRLLPYWQDYFTIKGVMTCGADVSPTVAAISERLRLPGIPLTVARATHNKSAVRNLLQAHGLQVFNPGFRDINAVSFDRNTEEIATYILGIIKSGFAPNGLVLKPLSRCASRGVTLIPKDCYFKTDNISSGIDLALAEGGEILVEEMLIGTEHSCEIIFLDGSEACFSNIVDRPFSYAGGVAMELGHINPTNLSTEKKKEIYTMCFRVARVLGVKWGAFKCDVIYTESGPKILECTSRLSGGFDCQYTTPISSGRNPIAALLELSTGVRPDQSHSHRHHEKFAACAAAFPPKGFVDGIQGSLWDEPTNDEIRNGSILSLTTVNVHDTIYEYNNCAQRAGFAVASGDTYKGSWSRARKGARLLEDRICII